MGGRTGSLRNRLSSCADAGTQAREEKRETGPRSHSKMETFSFGKGAYTFLFVPNHERPGRLWGSGQEATQSGGHDCGMCWGSQEKQPLTQAQQANRLTCGQKGLWSYLPSASVSFGLSSPAAKWPKRVRFDKSGKVRGGRWQDVRDQSLRDVPEPPLLHFLSKDWESQRPALPRHSLLPRDCGQRSELLISEWNRINS